MREISSQIWGGHDYTAGAFEAWLSDEGGEFVVALRGAQVVGFAHRTTLLPGYAWFEGIRVDSAHEGAGVAKAITRHLVEEALAAGAGTIGLSTYVDNQASMHIAEAMGFSRVASFVFLEAPPDAPARAATRRSHRAEPIPTQEAVAFVCGSQFLRVANGRLPHGWMFYPFARDPRRVLSQGQELIGIRQAGRLVALALVSRSLQHEGELAIDFIEGDAGAAEELARHVLHLVRDGGVVQGMAPRAVAAQAPSLSLLVDLGFRPWNDLAPDVFVYERIAGR